MGCPDMDLLALAARVAAEEQTGVIKKTPDKEEWCVKSEKKDSDWSGGCFPSKEKAENRLKQVEFFKHKKSSIALILANCELILASNEADCQLLSSFQSLLSSFNEEAEAVEPEHVSQEQQAKAPPGWKKTVEKMKGHEEIEDPFALAWYMKNKGDKPHKK